MARYDFNIDGKVSREDVRLILSYLPLNKETGKIDIKVHKIQHGPYPKKENE
jgi:hypothetical protein